MRINLTENLPDKFPIMQNINTTASVLLIHQLNLIRVIVHEPLPPRLS